MRLNLTKFFDLFNRALLADPLNFYLFLATIGFAGLDILTWYLRLARENLGELWHLHLSPIQFLISILIINLVLTLSSYDKEKQVAELLLGASLLASFFILIAEIVLILNG